MTLQEWKSRCAAQFVIRSKVHPETAATFVEAILEEPKLYAEYSDDPEGAANEEMEHWTDDGDPE